MLYIYSQEAPNTNAPAGGFARRGASATDFSNEIESVSFSPLRSNPKVIF